MRSFLISALVYVIYQSLRWTWRQEIHEPEELQKFLVNGRPFILAHWHGDELVLMQLAGRYRIGTIVSTSKDGDLMNRIFNWFGGRTVRGSSTRGGVGALKGLLRLIRGGANCSFAVDGPKGPLHKVKPGIFEVSKLLELPIFWAGVSADRSFEFPRSWNKTYLPKPFARVSIRWHGPLVPPSPDQDPRDPALALDLETKLHAAKQQAVAVIAKD